MDRHYFLFIFFLRHLFDSNRQEMIRNYTAILFPIAATAKIKRDATDQNNRIIVIRVLNCYRIYFFTLFHRFAERYMFQFCFVG